MELLENLAILSVPAIAAICFFITKAVKASGLDSKWLPVICGGVGGALGVAAMFLMPEFPAKDVLTALAIGIVSGFGATGAHQVFKQFTKD